jgi:hypothetical protein
MEEFKTLHCKPSTHSNPSSASYTGNLEVIFNGPKVQVAMPNLFSVADDVAVISANVGTGEWFDEDAQC